jgi:neutral ceramidase
VTVTGGGSCSTSLATTIRLKATYRHGSGGSAMMAAARPDSEPRPRHFVPSSNEPVIEMLLRVFLLAGFACWLNLVPPSAAFADLRAGAATSNITPPLGGDIVGGFLPIPAKHIHDELHARCLVLDDGETKLAIVICDLLGMHRSVSDAARAEIEKRLAIPKSHVLISATHTHSAVSVLGGSRYDVEQELDDYQRFVVARIVDGVQRAVNLLRPAELGFGSAAAPEHVFNRRWHLREGIVSRSPFGDIDQVKMNPPAGSADLVKPAGPTDPTVSFLAVREPDGAPIAVYAAYSLHYVGGVGSGHVSADYFGMFCNELARLQHAQQQDPPFVAMMANGTSGDINNINFKEPRPRKQPYEQMRFVAQDVAKKVHQALTDVTYRSDVTLGAVYREPVVQWRQPSPATLAWAKAKVAEPESDSRSADLPRIYARRTLGMADHPAKAPVPLQLLKIGDVSIGTMPCEVFCEIGLEFKQRSPLQPAFLVSLAHGYYGYLPTPAQHQLGGYETWLGTNRLESNTSEIFLDHLVEMAQELIND